MSSITIESFSKEVLLEIFDLLDGKSLKNSALVCKSWNEVIGSSSSTMRKLPLLLKSTSINKLSEINTLRRRHHTIILKSFTMSSSKFLEVFKNVGSNVRLFIVDKIMIEQESFTMSSSKFLEVFKNVESNVRQFFVDETMIEQDAFTKLIDSMPMLEKIVFIDCGLLKNAEQAINPTNLKKLKSLLMIRSNFKMIGYFIDTQVHELKIVSNAFYHSEHENFKKFLNNQTELKKLAIRTEVVGVLKTLVDVENKFKLKKLAVGRGSRIWKPTDYENLLKLLKIHESTLEDLGIEGDFSENVNKFIMQNLRLKRFIVGGSQLPKTQNFYESIRKNIHLKTLVIEDYLYNRDAALGLLHVYSSIEKLIIKVIETEIIDDVITFIAHNQKNLIILDFPRFAGNSPQITIPTLKTFQIEKLDNIAAWQSFLTNNPSIEAIAVYWIQDLRLFTYEVLDTITQRLQNLRHIKFGPQYMPSDNAIEMIQRNCPKMQLLEAMNNDPLNVMELKSNRRVGKMKIVFHPPEAMRSVFELEPTM